ncbi:MAG TPA: hypothetical protein VKT30_02455 [Caulobacteraceae bacterium]|nr:hypothetical protein [Caulobacteraceae bacterium]
MNRLVGVIVAIAGLGAGCAAIGAPSGPNSLVAAAFGNTVVSTYPDGRTAELWLHPGGRYDAKGRRGDPSSGRWRIKGQKICLSQSRPFPSPFSYCTALPRSGQWSARAVTGEAIRVRIVKGRYSGRA